MAAYIGIPLAILAIVVVATVVVGLRDRRRSHERWLQEEESAICMTTEGTVLKYDPAFGIVVARPGDGDGDGDVGDDPRLSAA